jgi:arylsulfatase A-like enzyme
MKPWLLAFALCGVLVECACAGEAPRKPNIVLIFADDLGWKDVGWNNDGGFIETPNLDRLKSQSMTFTSAYASAGNCAPSRACMLSGKYTPRHGVFAVDDTDRGPKDKFRLVPIPNNQQLKPEFVTMAEALKAQGYVTGHFGKWHLGSDAKGTGPRQQGFDVSPRELVPAGTGAEDDPKKMFSITRAAIDFIETNRSRPFFAFVSHHAVHTALAARSATLAKFREKAKNAASPHVKALYAACIADMDDTVGMLLKKLTELDLDKNTLVIFTSDNGGTGPSLNEPLRGAKGGYYEGGIREPFLARWPGIIKPGSTCDTPIINVDLYPTFIAASDGKPAGDLDGVSLVPLFKGGSKLDRAAMFWHFPGYLDNPVPRGRDPVFRTRPISVIRKGDWKLHLYHEEWLLDGGRSALATNRAVELYNIKTDIGERTDLANQETARRDELLDDLLAWIEKTKAPLASRP